MAFALDTGCFARMADIRLLVLYSRLTLDAAVAQGRVAVVGNPALARVLAQSLTPYFSTPRTPQA